MLRKVARELGRQRPGPNSASQDVTIACRRACQGGYGSSRRYQSVATQRSRDDVHRVEEQPDSSANTPSHYIQPSMIRQEGAHRQTQRPHPQSPPSINPATTPQRTKHRLLLRDEDLWTDGSGWADLSEIKQRIHTKRIELLRKLEEAPDPWRLVSPSLLFKLALRNERGAYPWMRLAALERSSRIQVVLVQMFLRRERRSLPEDIAQSLPDEAQWNKALRSLAVDGYTLKNLEGCLWILEGRTGEEQCQRFLERDGQKPYFLTTFLLRKTSDIRIASTLDAMMTYCLFYHFPDSKLSAHSQYPADTIGLENQTGAESPMPPTFQQPSLEQVSLIHCTRLVQLMLTHCHRLDPRLCIRISHAIGILLQQMASLGSDPLARRFPFQRQCKILNATINALRPRGLGDPVISGSFPNAYLWEAQRSLLSLSASLPKPLNLNRESFRAIRETLASQAKSREEMHNSRRHAQTWPPYLLPGDGLDEQAQPEENWSRTVRAGMMMQEAGYSLGDIGDALNVLEGMAPDGTPTIQQRVLADKKRGLDVWEASIWATRNAWEAWSNFQRPPETGMQPSGRHYAAMFEKLSHRSHDDGDDVLPGDRTLSFATTAEVNLTEHEKARLHPPSIDQLYRQMIEQGIPPSGRCLQILVANAPSVDIADNYLRLSDENQEAVHSLTTDFNLAQPDPITRLSIGVLAAYVKVCTKTQPRPKQTWFQLQRALRIGELCMKTKRGGQVVALWGPVLKNFSQHHYAMGLALWQQLQFILEIMLLIEKSRQVPLSMAVQFAKCIRKIARREMRDSLLKDLASNDGASNNPLRALYDRHLLTQPSFHAKARKTHESKALSLFRQAGLRLKHESAWLANAERKVLESLRGHDVPAADVMRCRQDLVRAGDAYEYMVALAYVGQFKGMAKLLRWLAQQWADAEFGLPAQGGVDSVPTHADFMDTLCAYRVLGEPMLDGQMAAEVEAAVCESGVDWVWPDEDALAEYMDRQEDDTIETLRKVLEWIRYRQRREKSDSGLGKENSEQLRKSEEVQVDGIGA